MPKPASEPLPLSELLESWLILLDAGNKSKQTMKSYGDGVRRFLDYCAKSDSPAVLDKATVNAFIAELRHTGLQSATMRSRQLAVRRFSAWLADEGEIPEDLLIGLKSPKLDEKINPSLTEAELVALIKACKGTELRDKRDEAMVRLMGETAMRAGECVALKVGDVNKVAGLVTIARGKGGRGRVVPISAATAQAIDRYIRGPRRAHVLADTDALWLGERGKGFTYDGMHKSLRRRAEIAELDTFHIHMLRRTTASRWLGAGGSEGGLMQMAGWRTRGMIDRYVRDTAAARSADEARRLGLGNI